MSRVYRQRKSPYWFADYALANGGRRRTSTKQRDKEAAKAVLATLLAAESLGKERKLNEQRARDLIGEIMERTMGARLQSASVRAWFKDWIEQSEGKCAPNTVVRYKQVAADFLKHLGSRADESIECLEESDLRAFYKAELAAGKRSKTAALSAKIVKFAFKRAASRKHLGANPFAGFEADINRGDSVKKKPFTWEEVAALYRAADSKWRVMIMLGLFAGLRISDAANLRWRNVDLGARLIRFLPKKTRRRAKMGDKPEQMQIPIHPQLEAVLCKLPGVDGSPEAYIVPELAERGTGGHTGLSEVFAKLMDAAGVDAEVVECSPEARGRKVRAKSFHSLRHKYVTELERAGASKEHRQAAAGHADEAMVDNYTDIDAERIRPYVEKIPTIPEATE